VIAVLVVAVSWSDVADVQLFCEGTVDAKSYTVVASTYDEGDEGDFTLVVFADKPLGVRHGGCTLPILGADVPAV
jgi:hypothetical protein